MSKVNRRNFFSLLGAGAATAVLGPNVAAQTQHSAAPLIKSDDEKVRTLIAASRERLRKKYFPNVELTTHEGKKVKFYDDLIKDKIVTINFFYATCDGICPGISRNLAKAQELLGDIVGKEVFMYSITLKPVQDTPEVLAEHARAMRSKPGWLFLTGAPQDIELLRRSQRFVDPDPELDKIKDQHIGNVRFGNEPMQTWGACPGLGKPEIIVDSLLWLDEKLKAKYLARKVQTDGNATSKPQTGGDR